MASAPSEETYLRYKHFATNKLRCMRALYRENRLIKKDIEALRDCVVVYGDVTKTHDDMV